MYKKITQIKMLTMMMILKKKNKKNNIFLKKTLRYTKFNYVK